MDDRERHAAGMQVRRAVLGDAHVDRANAAQTDLTAPFQDLITRYAWGEIWTRPGLPRHTRSLLTIAMMVALGRDGELRLHLRAASNNGVTRDEIQETLLQTAIYCGVSYERDGKKNIGVIAQEIREILPEVVHEGNDEQKTLSVSYGNIVGLLVEAIKELNAKVEDLQNQLANK